jgi:hypothetical protein
MLFLALIGRGHKKESLTYKMHFELCFRCGTGMYMYILLTVHFEVMDLLNF